MLEFTMIKALVEQYLPEEGEGQGLVEYALILVLVSIVVIVMLTALGAKVGTVFTSITNKLTPAT
jgi:pilus assembly protein Flp/PilA